MKLLLSVLLTQILALSAYATTDSISTYKFIYLGNVHEDPVESFIAYYPNYPEEGYRALKSFCVGESIFWDGVSSSAYPIFEFMTQPFITKTYGFNDTTIDLNVLSSSGVKFGFDFDSVSNFVIENEKYILTPDFTIDLTGLPMSNYKEKFAALVYAKLAIIGIHLNTEAVSSDGFKASIEVIGLPDQSKMASLSGFSKVYAMTKSKYSASSPVVEKYKEELLDDRCQ